MAPSASASASGARAAGPHDRPGWRRRRRVRSGILARLVDRPRAPARARVPAFASARSVHYRFGGDSYDRSYKQTMG